MRKDLDTIYEEMKKEAREFAKKEGLKLSITRKDYNVITVIVVSGKEKVLENKDRSDDLFYDKRDFKKEYNQYSEDLDANIELRRYENTDNSNEIADRLENTKMTQYGFKIAKKLFEIMNKNYWDESDMMVDYFNQAFYGHLYLGSYNKPYIIKEVA